MAAARPVRGKAGAETGPVAPPQANVFLVLQFLAWGAMLGALALLALALSGYDFKIAS